MDKIPKILITFVAVALILVAVITCVLYLNSQKEFNEPMPNETEILEMIRKSENLKNPEVLRIAEDGDENFKILVALYHDKASEDSTGFVTIYKTRPTLTEFASGGESFSYGEEGGRRITAGGLHINNKSYFYIGSVNCDPRIASYKIEYFAPDLTLQTIERKIEEKTFLELYEGNMSGDIIYYDEDGNDITEEIYKEQFENTAETEEMNDTI